MAALPALLPGIAIALSVSAPPVRAQGIDLTQGGPIQITAQNGIEWRQTEQVVIAKGDAKAVRGDVTVTADQLIAWYRRKAGAGANQPPAGGVDKVAQSGTTQSGPAQSSGGLADATQTEGNEVYRMRAEGNVHIYTQTDQGWGDQATYDLDQAVLVMTGSALKLTTPNDTLTARDTVEYWSQKHMAVARGDAVVVTNDGRRVSADTLVAFTLDAPAASASASATPGTPTPGNQPRSAGQAANGDSVTAMAGRLERVEAFNNVSIRTQTDTVTGDRAVYVPDTGVAHLGGNVRITRGLNQINGSEAVVNMKTGVATLLAGDTGRVTGLVTPNDKSTPAPDEHGGQKPSPDHPKTGAAP